MVKATPILNMKCLMRLALYLSFPSAGAGIKL